MSRPSRSLRLEALEDRTTPALALDPTFGTGGTLGVDTGYAGGGVDTLVQPDGKVLVSSWYDNAAVAPPWGFPSFDPNPVGTALFRFNKDGSPDTTFGT